MPAAVRAPAVLAVTFKERKAEDLLRVKLKVELKRIKQLTRGAYSKAVISFVPGTAHAVHGRYVNGARRPERPS